MTHERATFLRSAGPITGGLLLAIIALMLHPHMSGHAAPQTELHEMGKLEARDRLVHGTLLLLLGALLTGFASYTVRRGFTRRLVVFGLVGFSLGIGGLFAAGLIDGFISPAIAARFVIASAVAQAAAIAALTACAVAVNVLTAFAILAMAIAIAAWSFDLVQDVGESRIAGAVGFVSAALTVAVLISGGPSVRPHTLIAVLCAQGVWYVWIAVLVGGGRV